jgi:adenosylcobinamide-GDP ribazoletransferase
MGMPVGLVSAVRTLSLLPIPGRDADELSASLPWFPLVGTLIGALVAATGILLDIVGLSSWSAGSAVVLTLLSIILTRGIHLDGLADSADGLFSMTDKMRTLAIMKDSRIGTFGVLALISVLGLKCIALKRLIEAGLFLWILPAYIISRTVMADLSAVLPYARSEGGTGAPFVSGAENRHRFLAWGSAIPLLAVVGPAALGALLSGGLMSNALARLFRNRVGGATGDLLGAASETTETLHLTLFAALSLYDDLLPGFWSLPW